MLSDQIVKLIMHTASSSIAVNFSPNQFIECKPISRCERFESTALIEIVLSIQIACVSTLPIPHLTPKSPIDQFYIFVNGGD